MRFRTVSTLALRRQASRLSSDRHIEFGLPSCYVARVSNDRFEAMAASQFMPSNYSRLQGKFLTPTNGMLHSYLDYDLNWRRIHQMAAQQDRSVPPYGYLPGGGDPQYWLSSGEGPLSVLAFMGEGDRRRIAADPDTDPADLQMMASDPSPSVRSAVAANASTPMQAREFALRQQPAAAARSTPSTSGGCYIATAVYGSYDAPQVLVLRRFRDDTLSRSISGRALVRAYYSLSPRVARHFGGIGVLNRAAKSFLNSLVARLDRSDRLPTDES